MYKVERMDVCICVNSSYDYYLQNVKVIKVNYDRDDIVSVKIQRPVLSKSPWGNPRIYFHYETIIWDTFKNDFKLLNLE